ncbi:SpoIIE family protein phosphatase [Candidatus Protofrankia californiensis]|uniref:SpoIIE family protein phosphatase n=1 Tax=Candidatus Protofrankia californiensis TaxID=1839754 RepID=UPI001041BD13|nr:SpoIIE family protein phosphatase [Candidatus Protofrankia californiensis]
MYAAENADRLAVARERFLSGDPVGKIVPVSIRQSWLRCQTRGLPPSAPDIRYDADIDTDGGLVHAARPVLDNLATMLSGMGASMVLTDARATVLQRRADEPALIRALDSLLLAPGFGFSERLTGTNGMGTALEERRSCFIVGHEHFADSMQSFACAGAPIRDPLSGRIEGCLDVTCLANKANEAMRRIVQESVRAIEQRMLDQVSARERALLRAFFRSAHGTPEPRTRTAAGRPGPAATASTAIPGMVPTNRHDQLLLMEKAAELISAGRPAVVEVTLSRGGTAVLLCRPVAGTSGETGAVVEACLPSTGRVHLTDSTYPVAVPDGGVPMPESGRREPAEAVGRQLLLAGEPAVSRLALAARRRLGLLCEAGVRIGTTLDVRRTAEELVEMAVGEVADVVAVDLADSVLRGEGPVVRDGSLRRVARSATTSEPGPFYQVGELVAFAPTTPQAQAVLTGQPVFEPDLSTAVSWLVQDPARAGEVIEKGTRSLITVPLRARGAVLGVVSFYRTKQSGPFEEDDLSLAEELVSRAAMSIDNARRFTGERALALALQRSLLPRTLPEQNAVEVAHRYLPAESDVGGDWYDVIPLSSLRVALVVGDVVGHGIRAAATMGRLRTAVHNFAVLDLPPDELLTRLDDLVDRIDQEQAADDGDIIGATCLYAIYDPVSRRATMARAGHPPPALVHPDGTVEFPEVPAGPPLGLGGQPFETAELDIADGSHLVLYTDGLVEDRDIDIDVGLGRLAAALACPAGRPAQICDAVMTAVPPAHAGDDVALLVARTRTIPTSQVVRWDLPSEPSAVPRLRAASRKQLAEWSLETMAFTTELILSELMTNAIRHASGPIEVRLLRDRTLISEVSDASSTSPHLRRASATDEGGRGLFLVAQLARRWGTRYTDQGKTIWVEQELSRW